MRDRIGAAFIAVGKKIRKTDAPIVVKVNLDADAFIRGMRRAKGFEAGR